MMNFNRKVIFLTGSNGNLGKSLVSYFLQYNCKIIALDKDKIKVKNNKISFYQVDFNNINNLKSVLNLIKKKFNKIDFIINNAGLTHFNVKKNELNSFSLEKWSSSLNINLISADLIIRELSKKMPKKNDSSILNVASIYGCLKPDFSIYKNTEIVNNLEYAASKAALIQLTKWYSGKLCPIRINSISPGGIFNNHKKKFANQYSSKTLLKRMAKKEEIINSMIFLLSNNASYITGENIIVDGGFLSR